MIYGVTRFHLAVLFTWLLAGLLPSQQIFAIFSNYSPKWQCGDGVISKNCTIFKECRGNLTFHDQYFQSAALEFGWICSDEAYLMSLFSQVQFVGVFFGTFLFGSLSDIFGRKPISITTLSIGFLFNILSGLATSWKMLHTIRFLLGFCIGGTMVTMGTFVTELLLPEQRMLLRGVFNWGVVRFILTMVCMLFPEWRSASIVSALFILPAILSIIVVFPESPTWLHNKGRLEALKVAERYIASFSGEKYEYVDQKSIEHVKTFCEMWSTPGLFRRLGVLWLMWFVAAFSSYSNDLNSNTISGNLFVNQILFAVLITISKLILLTTDTWLPKFSRRHLHQGAQSVVCACFLVLSVLTLHQYTGVGVLVISLIGCVFIEYTWDACFLCAVESLETSCRGGGIGSCSLVARIGAISTPFLTHMNIFWPPSLYFSVFILGCINLIVSYKFLIETKGVNLDSVKTAIVNEMDEFSTKHTLSEKSEDLLKQLVSSDSSTEVVGLLNEESSISTSQTATADVL